MDADAQPLQGRKSADEAIADFRHDQAVRDQKRAQAMARDAQYKAMGLINHKGQGTKITGKYKNGQSEEFVVIGEAGRKRHLAKDSKGNFVTIAHDGTVLKEEYVTATNLFDKGEKVDGSMKIRQKNGKTVTINKKFVKVGTLEKGRSAVIDEKGRSYVMAQDGRILDSNFVVRDRQADVLRKDAGAARTATLNMMRQQIDSAQAAFDKQMEDDGWAGDVADGISVLWGSKNRASKVREDLKQYKKDMAELNAAAKKGDAQFKTKFKQMFGVDYNQNAVANYYAHPTSTNYQKAFGTKNDIGTRVAKYNESQQTGAAVVKTTTKVAAGFAVAAVTGGTGLVALGAAAVATGAASVVVEESDRLKIGQAVTQGKFEFREGTDHAQIFKNAAWDAGAVLVGGGVGKAASTIVKGSKVVTAGGQTVQALTKTQKLGRAAINVTGDLAYGAVQEKVQTGDITVKGTVLNGATALVGQAVQSGVAVKLGNKVKDAVEGGFSKGKAKITDTAHKFTHTKSSAPAQQAPSFKTTMIDPPTSNVNYKVNPDADATVTKIIKNYEPDPVTTIDKNMFKLSNDKSGSLELDIPQMPQKPKYASEDMVKVLDELNKASSLSDLKDFTDLLKSGKLSKGQQQLLQKQIDAKRRNILEKPSYSRVASTDVREVANSKRSSALQNHQTIELNRNDKIRLGDSYELDLRDPKVKAKINSLKPGQSLLVGRSRIADIQIDNKYGSVSRTHLVIENINGKLYATDLTSTNGTALNNSILRNISAVKGAMVRESVEKYVDIEKDDLMES